MTLDEIAALPVADVVVEPAHLYLWVPNALLPEGLRVMQAWGFEYKSNIVWHKIRKDGGPDGRGVGFYFRNTTELLLFGIRGKNARTLAPGRRQVNYLATQKREHSRKPDEQYPVIEACSPGPRLELFARGPAKVGRSSATSRKSTSRPGTPTRTIRRRTGHPSPARENPSARAVRRSRAGRRRRRGAR
jgi:N6-adenosine-specific RNA methylase IME4